MTDHRVDWFRRDPAGGTICARPEVASYSVEIQIDVRPITRALAEASGRLGRLADESTPDTSQPYFLDLIGRIDAVTGSHS